MPRPVKPRRISALPHTRAFHPDAESDLQVIIKFDEYEAIRLKDVEGLNQEEASQLMQVSRQTFQLILDSARKKIGLALVEGRSIIIDGGDVMVDICKYVCATCGHEFSEIDESDHDCPKCGKREAMCKPTEDYCKKCCKKSRKGRCCNIENGIE